MHQNLRFGTDVLTRSIRMAGFNTNGKITGIMGSDGTSGISADDAPLYAIIPWDNDGSSGTDAITVVYADPSTIMDTSYAVLEPCTTTSISFQPNRGANQLKLQRVSPQKSRVKDLRQHKNLKKISRRLVFHKIDRYMHRDLVSI